jgi:hypothetical protein
LGKEYLEAFLALKEEAVDDKDAEKSEGAGALGGEHGANMYDDSFDKIVLENKKSE